MIHQILDERRVSQVRCCHQRRNTVGVGPVHIFSEFDERAFAAAETAGGRELRATLDDWIASVNAFTQNGALVVNVSYTVPNRGTQLAQFRYDPVSDKATRTSP